MRANLFVLGLILFFLGSVMYLSVSATASGLLAKAFGQNSDLNNILSRGSQLASVTEGLLGGVGSSLGQANVSLVVMILGIGLAIASEEDRLHKGKPRRSDADQSELKRNSIVVLRSIPSIVIGWLVLSLIYLMGFATFWYTAVTIIMAYLITSYLINSVSSRGEKSIAFMVFFGFIFVSAVLGSIISAIFLTYAQQNVASFGYAAFASLIVVVLTYWFFHTQQYKETGK